MISDWKIDDFIREVEGKNFRLKLPEEGLPPPRSPERLDALFHLPLLALVIMVLAARKEALPSAKIGQKVSAILVKHFSGLRAGQSKLECSITLRRRCVEALVFLEAANHVVVSAEETRIIKLTPSASSALRNIRRNNRSDLGQLVRGLFISASRVSVRQEGSSE